MVNARIHRILVPLDGSELADRALPWADLLAQKAGASLELIRVIPTPAAVASQTMSGPAPVPHAYTDVTELVGAMRDEAQAGLERARSAATTPADIVIAEGPAATAIVQRAEEGEFDMIVMSTRGAGGLARLVLGSVADEVVRSASRPVLLIPAD